MQIKEGPCLCQQMVDRSGGTFHTLLMSNVKRHDWWRASETAHSGGPNLGVSTVHLENYEFINRKNSKLGKLIRNNVKIIYVVEIPNMHFSHFGFSLRWFRINSS